MPLRRLPAGEEVCQDGFQRDHTAAVVVVVILYRLHKQVVKVIKDDGITACCLLSDTAQGDHTPVDVPYENVYTIGYIPFKVIEKGVAHGGVVIVGIHPEPYAIWRQLGHFIVAVRCLGDNLVGC